MININGIVHIADNDNPGIWYEFGFGWAKAVEAVPFDTHSEVKQRLAMRGIMPTKDVHNAIVASILGKSVKDRAVIKAFIDRVRKA